MSKTIHVSLDVRGALTNWPDRMLKGMFRHPTTGAPCLAWEAKRQLADLLADGHLYLPLSKEPCEGFDPRTGCPGHDDDRDAAEARALLGLGPWPSEAHR